MTDAQVYVGTYAKYNNGNLAGAWLSLGEHDTAEAFDAAARKLHNNERDPELMFQDCQGFPDEFYGESWLDERIWEWLALDKRERAVVEAWLDSVGGTESIQYILDHHVGSADSWDDYVADYIEQTGMLDSMPESLRGYFDFDAYGRDLWHEFTVAETSDGVKVFLSS